MLGSYEHWRYTLARTIETQQKFEKYLKSEAPEEQTISWATVIFGASIKYPAAAGNLVMCYMMEVIFVLLHMDAKLHCVKY